MVVFMEQKLVAAGIVILILAGCNTGSSDSNTSSSASSAGSSASKTGMFNLAFSDAPVDGMTKVCVAFDKITVHHTDGSESSWGTSSFAAGQSSPECLPEQKMNSIPGYAENKPEFMVINLMGYQGKKSLQVLSDEPMEAGEYTQMRLSVLENDYYTDGMPYSHVEMTTGSTYGIRVPSGELKLDGFEIKAGATQGYTLEFDLRKSMVYNNNGYQLKPRGVRLVHNSSVATISGEVQQDSPACGGELDKAFVYVYTAPSEGYYGDLGSEYEPYTSTAVDNDSRAFEIGYLPLGEYDIALVCKGDEDRNEVSSDQLDIYSVYSNKVLTASGLTFTF